MKWQLRRYTRSESQLVIHVILTRFQLVLWNAHGAKTSKSRCQETARLEAFHMERILVILSLYLYYTHNYIYRYIQYAVVCDLRPVRHLFPAVSDATHGISLQNSCSRQVRQVRNRCLGAQAQSFDLSRSRNWNPGVYRPGLMAMI